MFSQYRMDIHMNIALNFHNMYLGKTGNEIIISITKQGALRIIRVRPLLYLCSLSCSMRVWKAANHGVFSPD